jgi:hypothetical protein
LCGTETACGALAFRRVVRGMRGGEGCEATVHCVL